MRYTFAGLLLAFCLTTAHAADRGLLLKTTELREKPFSDAKTLANFPAKTALAVITRKGAWAKISIQGKTGWIKVLNITTDKAKTSGADLATAGRVLATGSSGRQSTTGIKGIREEALKKAKPAPEEVRYLDTLGASADSARQFARANGLKSQSVDDLPN